MLAQWHFLLFSYCDKRTEGKNKSVERALNNFLEFCSGFLVLVFLRASVSPVSAQKKKKTLFHTMKVWKPFLDAKSLPKTPVKLNPAAGEGLAASSKSALMDELEASLQQLLASSDSPP